MPFFFSQNKYSPFVFIEQECIEFIYSPAIWGVICPHLQIAPLGPFGEGKGTVRKNCFGEAHWENMSQMHALRNFWCDLG